MTREARPPILAANSASTKYTPMKRSCTGTIVLFLLLHLGIKGELRAQCLDGTAPKSVLTDTTIKFKTGATSLSIKFPQFDPEEGMLTCVKLTVTMIGVIDTVAMQNLSSETQTASFDYVRNDQMSGPGLSTPLSNSYSQYYGAYSLTAFDGDFTSGTDYVAIPRDTVLRKKTVKMLNDSAEIAQFYGHDSVMYNYQINVSTAATITGGSSSSLVLTSALVNFKFEYCTCPKATLPLGPQNFSVTKSTAESASLYWEGSNDEYAYVYDVEMSRDGRHFSQVATLDRQYMANPSYLYSYQISNNEYGRYYFRIRQHWSNGYVRFTPVKSVEFINPLFAFTGLYPNPSTGTSGIKFVNVKPGKMLVQVSGANGQLVFAKEAVVAQTDYLPLSPLPKGMYWIRITDQATKTFCVKQLIVQ